MKHLTYLALVVAPLLGAGTAISAHDGTEHVRGVVASLQEHSFAVKTDGATSRVLSVTTRTTVTNDGKRAQFKDLRVGDRVFIEVPERTTEALEIDFTRPQRPAEERQK